MTIHSERDMNQIVEADWNRLKQQYGGMYNNPLSYFHKVPNIETAFQNNDKNTLRCIDCGTPGGLHLAGSGCRQTEEKAIEYARKMGVTGVTSHVNCGAAALAVQELGLDIDPDIYAQNWSIKLSRALDVPYVGHITGSEFKRPLSHHPELAAYLVGEGGFDPTQLEALPPGFTISAGLIPHEVVQAEVKLAIDIALGPHGFGNHFTEEYPFVVAVEQVNDSSSNELKELLGPLIAKYNNRVVYTQLLRGKS